MYLPYLSQHIGTLRPTPDCIRPKNAPWRTTEFTKILQEDRHFLMNFKFRLQMKSKIGMLPHIDAHRTAYVRDMGVYIECCLGSQLSNLSRARGAYSVWLTSGEHATRPAYISVRVLGGRIILVSTAVLLLLLCIFLWFIHSFNESKKPEGCYHHRHHLPVRQTARTFPISSIVIHDVRLRVQSASATKQTKTNESRTT